MAKTTVPGLYIADGAITAAKLSSTLDLSGVTITVATASTGDSDTSVASTAFVQQEIAALVDSSPSALNTLNELAAAIGDDASFSTTITNSIATKLALAGGTMTGDLIINTTGSIQIPVGTTAQRPTAAQGQLRFNTTTSKPEIYNGSAWADVGGGVESVNSATGAVTLDTDDISEGSSNLYFTNARADARIAAATTDDLSEGSTNLYFTTARANSAFDGRLSGSTGVTVSNGAVSIGQDIATSTSPTFQNLTLSGTDSIKVPSGTTAQRSGSPANGMLRYNSSTNEFEGYADSAWGAIGGDTTSSVDLYTATGNGSTATYDTGKNPQSENNTWVFIGGVYQPKSTYSFSGTQITLSENLPNGEDLEVITGTVSTYNPTDAILGQYNVTTSNTASYDTSLTTENENNVFVFVDGVYQPKSSYTYSGSTLTLDAVPTSGMSLEVLVTRSMNAATVTTGFLADDAVTTAKITDANVTAGKLASSLDLTGKTVTVATASAGDNDTSVASTAFVRQEITSLVDSAPAAMDTLNELAAALGDDANFSTTVNNSIALKAPLASPDFTGQLQATNSATTTHELIVTGNNTRSAISMQSKDSSGNAVDLRMHSLGDGPRGEIFTFTNHDLAFATNNAAPQMILKTDGKVGIGETSPLGLLHIKGTGDAIRVESTNAGTGGAQIDLLHFTASPADNDVHGSINFGGYYSGSSSAYGSAIKSVWSDVSAKEGQLQFFTRDDSDFAARMVIDKDGNVGIGTGSDTLTGKLTVKDSGTMDINLIGNPPELNLEDTSSTSGTKRGRLTLDDNKLNIQGLADNDQSVTQNLFVANLSNGNVGIGETNPGEKLQVNGAIAVTGSLIDDRTATGTMDYVSGITRFVAYGGSGSENGQIAFNTAVGGGSSTVKARISAGFANTSTTALPAFRTEGSYGGGIGMLDGASQAGWYQQDSGDTFHHYVGKESSDTPASKIVLTTRSNGHVGIMQGGSNAINHPLHITREEAGYQVNFDNDNGSAQGLKIRIKANDSGNFNAINTVSASSGSDKTVFNVRDDGIVTTPEQVYFLARRSGNLTSYNMNVTSGATTAIFNNVLSAQSSAAGIAAFNTTNGTFTAPVAGLYLFHYSFYSDNTIEQAWLTNSSGGRIYWTDVTANTDSSYTSGVFSVSIQYYMSEGASIRVHPYSSGSTGALIYDNDYHTYWKGVLLG